MKPGLVVILLLLPGLAQDTPAQGVDLAGSYYHFSRAKLYELNKEFIQASSEYERAIGLNPGNSPLRVEFAQMLWRLGEVRRAVEQCQKAMELDAESPEPHFLLGQIYSNFRQDPDNKMRLRAMEAFERTLQLDPRHAEALYYQAQLKAERDEHVEAVALLERFLELRPFVMRAYLLKARSHLQLDQIEEAAQTLQDSLSYDSADLENAGLLGTLLERTDRLPEAVEVYQALREEVSNPEIDLRLARVLNRLGQFEEAAGVLEPLLQHESRQPEVLQALGEALKGQRRYARAADAFEEILKEQPGDFSAGYQLADCLARMGRRPEALERLARLEESVEGEQKAAVLTSMALIHQDLGDHEQSVESLRKVVGLNPEDDIARLRLAYGFQEAGRIDEALALSGELADRYADASEDVRQRKYFMIGRAQILSSAGEVERAVDLLMSQPHDSKDHIEYRLVASQIHLDHKQYAGAREIVERGRELFPDNDRLTFQLAAIQERQGDFDRSEELFLQLIDKDPDHAGALNYLGYMLADRGVRLDTALDYIARAVELDPFNGAYLDSLGWVYFRLGELEKAEANLLLAARIADSDPTIFEHLGDLYLELGQLQEARRHYRRSVELAGEEEELRRVEAKLADLERRLESN